ncbi:hypothetical protein FE74_15605, partial [Staphylococcus aureus]
LVEVYEQLKENQGQIKTTKKENQQTNKELTAVDKEIKNIEKIHTDTKKAQNEYEVKLYQAYLYTEKMKTRIDSLSTQEEEYTYFFNGVKHILKTKNKEVKGIYYAVAAIIDVPSKLTQAIETALGASFQR